MGARDTVPRELPTAVPLELLGSRGFSGFSYGQVLRCFHMAPSWAKLGQDEHKLGQGEDSSPELLGTGWGTGSKKGTRDAVPRELAGS